MFSLSDYIFIFVLEMKNRSFQGILNCWKFIFLAVYKITPIYLRLLSGWAFWEQQHTKFTSSWKAITGNIHFDQISFQTKLSCWPAFCTGQLLLTKLPAIAVFPLLLCCSYSCPGAHPQWHLVFSVTFFLRQSEPFTF